MGRGAFVGILHENSWDSVLAVVGVLRTGAAYVPLDARWPATRIAAPLRQSGIGWLVTGHALARRAEEAGQLAGSGVRLVCTDLRAAAPDPLDTETVGLLWDTVAEDEDLARARASTRTPATGSPPRRSTPMSRTCATWCCRRLRRWIGPGSSRWAAVPV